MQTRIFGRTAHASTIAILGAAAFEKSSQAEADTAMVQCLEAGVNTIDVAPSYGEAELRLSPWMQSHRERFFLCCKTGKREKEEARAELKQSLSRLHVDNLDLYQLHSITSMEELDAATQPGGALDAIHEAHLQGQTRFVGITGHGYHSPRIFITALERYDFDAVMFSLNCQLYSMPGYRQDVEALLTLCRQRRVAVMIINALAKAPWGDRPRRYRSWYEPFTDPIQIQAVVNFVLSQNVTGLISPADPLYLPAVLKACQDYNPLDDNEQANLLSACSHLPEIFKTDGQPLVPKDWPK